MRRIVLATLCAAAMAACSRAEPPQPAAPETSAEAPAGGAQPSGPAVPAGAAPDAAPAAASETVGGDGSELVLNGVAPDDWQGQIQGELGCSFTVEGQDLPLMIGRAFVGKDEHSFGMIKVGDYPERVGSTSAGGYDAMTDGTTYSGKGMTVTITRLSTDSLDKSSEQVVYPAALRADRADGARRTWTGTWTCGP